MVYYSGYAGGEMNSDVIAMMRASLTLDQVARAARMAAKINKRLLKSKPLKKRRMRIV